jgi:hypothetical protein
MRKIVLIAGFFLTAYADAQVVETRNITPLTGGAPNRFEKIAIPATGGKDIFVQGRSGDKIVLFTNDGLYWRDVSKGSSIVPSVAHIFARQDSLVYMFSETGNLFYWNESSSGGGFTEWDISKGLYAAGNKQVMGMDRSGELFFLGAIFNGEKNTHYYVSQRSMSQKAKEKDWEWAPVQPKKIAPEIANIFETYQMKQVTGASKNQIYVLLQDKASPKNVIIRWNGKAWDLINEQPDSIRNILVGNNGSLYANGNFSTPDGKDCLLQWDGKVWTSVAIEGLKRGTPKVMTMDHNGTLFLGGLAPSGKEYFVLEWNGSAFRYFGAAPPGMHDMVVSNDKAYVIGKGKDGGIYMVPRGGLVTANTNKPIGTKKDKQVQRVYDVFYWYSQIYLQSTEEAYRSYETYYKSSTKENAVTLKNVLRSTISQFFMPARDSIAGLTKSLRVGDNLFLDYLKELNAAQYGFYNELEYVAGYRENMYYNATDLKRDMDRVGKLYKISYDMAQQLSIQLDGYAKRNDELVMRDNEAIDVNAPVKPNDKTLTLFDAYKTFEAQHASLKDESDRTYSQFSSFRVATEAAIASDISKFSSASSSEGLMISRINSKLSSIWAGDVQPEASPFHTAFTAYLDARRKLLSARTEAGAKFLRSELSKEVRSSYLSIAARAVGPEQAAYSRFQKALEAFRKRFTL